MLEQLYGETYNENKEKCIFFFPVTFSLSPAGAMLTYSLN